MRTCQPRRPQQPPAERVQRLRVRTPRDRRSDLPWWLSAGKGRCWPGLTPAPWRLAGGRAAPCRPWSVKGPPMASDDSLVRGGEAWRLQEGAWHMRVLPTEARPRRGHAAASESQRRPANVAHGQRLTTWSVANTGMSSVAATASLGNFSPLSSGAGSGRCGRRRRCRPGHGPPKASAVCRR